MEFYRAVATIPSVVIPNPLNDAYYAKVPLPLEERDMRILYLGRYNIDKGILELAEAAEYHIGSDPRIVYRFHGIGKSSLISKQSDRMEIQGWIEGYTKIQLIRRSLAVVLPSYYEGFPNVIIEAMACGTPVVATAVGGLREIVQQGETGLLVPPRNAKELRQALIRISSDKTLWKRCSAAGHQKAAAYRLDLIAEQWRAVYEAILKE